MKDLGARKLVMLFVTVWSFLLTFYGFLAVRARLWSPHWAAVPTTKVFTVLPETINSRDAEVKKGESLYQQYHCIVCHGPNGQGGVRNPNADPNEMVPNLIDLEGAFTWNDLLDKIKRGAHPSKLDDQKPEPYLSMPSWKDTIPEQNLKSIAQYLFSLKSKPDKKTVEG